MYAVITPFIRNSRQYNTHLSVVDTTGHGPRNRHPHISKAVVTTKIRLKFDRRSTAIGLQFDRVTTFYVTAYLFWAAALYGLNK